MPTLPASLGFLNPLVVDDLRRYGSANDGGYVLPKSRVDACDAVISLGISDNWTLESHLANERPALAIHAYDHTISEQSFARQVRREAAYLVFLGSKPSTIAAKRRQILDYRRVFARPRIHFCERVCNRPSFENEADMAKVFSRLPDARHAFVKMDIEGDEYRAIPQMLGYSDRIDLIAVEFHGTEPLRESFERNVRAILRDFEIVHLHGNNWTPLADDGLPDCVEATFVNRRFVGDGPRRNHLPLSGIDAPCDPSRPDVALDF